MKLPDREKLVSHVVQSLSLYWSNNSKIIFSIPISNNQTDLSISIPLRMVSVSLPQWGEEFGVNGSLLVPRECIKECQGNDSWKKVDWWLAAFLLQECWHERLWEKAHGVIHSYSFRLKGWDTRAWDHAWVNRIGLFLRKWLLVENKKEEIFLGNMPKAKFEISHDVDAVSKTLPIRLKQGAFNFFNSYQLLIKGNFLDSFKVFGKAIRMLLSQEDWWVFEKLMQLEKKAGIQAVYHFYADDRSKNFKRWLMDPSYDVSTDQLKSLFGKIKKDGHKIGLHPTFDSWNNSELLNKQKNFLEHNLGGKVITCRQHWLRFSWNDTWNAQSKAGLERDSTLMFNDRAGFRNSSALSWNPWDYENSKSHQIKCLTSVIMDSHLYDYQNITTTVRICQIEKWLNECKSVHGECSTLWHPHTLTNDYSWDQGFYDLLEFIK